ncbi:hypothetical protein ORQ98_11410 [Spartinivicinus sp. A2-2]|uniref:Ribosomal protein L32 n=2 Tax=Spartinivicinus poritis TaxID=2994640 RepID=A0ABT5U869_9GAMM|nr:hypothetical protein [Spartinivicinus sp. A2-2]
MTNTLHQLITQVDVSAFSQLKGKGQAPKQSYTKPLVQTGYTRFGKASRS